MNTVTFQKAPASSQPGTVTARQDLPPQTLAWVQWGQIRGDIAVQYDLQAALAVKVEEAPTDGKQYGRTNAAWTEVISLQDAPETGTLYGREDGEWVAALPLEGGTLMGPLTLAGDPVSNFQAATKQYVDAVDADVSALALVVAGKEPTVAPGAAGQWYRYNKTWAAIPYSELTGKPTLGTVAALSYPGNTITFLRGDGTFASPTAAAAWGSITGTLSAQTDLQTALDAKVNKSGDSMTGSLNIVPVGSWATIGLNNPSTAHGSGISGSRAGLSRWSVEMPSASAAGDFRINAFNDAGTYTITPLQIGRATGNVTIGPGAAPTGTLGSAVSTGLILSKLNGTVGSQNNITGTTNGVLRWNIRLGDGSATETGANAGSNFVIARYDDAGAVIGDSIAINRASSEISMYSNTANVKTLTLYGGGSQGANLGLNNSVYAGTRFIRTNGSGELSFINNVYNLETHRFGNTGDYVMVGQAYKPGGGSFVDSSDGRLKENIEDYTSGLAEILALRPRTYNFRAETGRDPQKRYIRLVAQEAELAMPELVTAGPGKLGALEFPDMRVVDESPIPYALVNAVQELQAQITALQARIAALEAA